MHRASGVTSGHIIEIAHQGKPVRLRRIGYRAPESGKRHEFLAHHFGLGAKTIADIYKECRQMELFLDDRRLKAVEQAQPRAAARAQGEVQTARRQKAW